MSLDILNCGLGDLKFSFDPANPIERDRAARAVTDMLKRGYVLFVTFPGGEMRRVTEFDPALCEYIVSDVPGEAAEKEETRVVNQAGKAAEEVVGENPPKLKAKSGGKRGRPRRVPAHGATATAIAPRAGG